jgi:hypothetical protein
MQRLEVSGAALGVKGLICLKTKRGKRTKRYKKERHSKEICFEDFR